MNGTKIMCNFRELRNAIERTVLLSRGKIIPQHLPRRLQTSANASGKPAVETAKLSRTKYKILIGTQFLRRCLTATATVLEPSESAVSPTNFRNTKNYEPNY